MRAQTAIEYLTLVSYGALIGTLVVASIASVNLLISAVGDSLKNVLWRGVP